MSKLFTAIIQADWAEFVAFCPELDIASQGNTVEAARNSLQEALQVYFECASPAEIEERLGGEVLVTQLEVSLG